MLSGAERGETIKFALQAIAVPERRRDRPHATCSFQQSGTPAPAKKGAPVGETHLSSRLAPAVADVARRAGPDQFTAVQHGPRGLVPEKYCGSATTTSEPASRE